MEREFRCLQLSQRCKCGVENSLRFSLRVMEAMRALQRDAVDQLATSTAEDIVEHIRTNYRNDGDLYAQVRTVLRQVCSQGLVFENVRRAEGQRDLRGRGRWREDPARRSRRSFQGEARLLRLSGFQAVHRSIDRFRSRRANYVRACPRPHLCDA